MKETKVAQRYAKSLLSLGLEKNILADLDNDFSLIKSTCDENRDLVLLLKSPVVKTDQKIGVLTSVFTSNISETSLLFIQLLARKKREYLLKEVAVAFQQLVLKHKGIVEATIKSAVVLDDALKASLIAKIKGESNGVSLTEIIDPNLIGGFIVKVGDQQVDASISSKLSELKRKLTDNSFIAQI